MLKPYRIKRYKCQLVADGHLPIASNVRVEEAREAARIFSVSLANLPHEEIHALFVNGRGRPVGLVKISQGGLHGCAMTARDLLRPAVVSEAAAIILAHNHPSGDPTPSDDDIQMTKHMTKCCELIGIPLLDHIVCCPEAGLYHSMTETDSFRL